MTDQPPITDHVFRAPGDAHVRSGKLGGPALDSGMCGYNGTCNRPQDDHITVPDFRARRRAA